MLILQLLKCEDLWFFYVLNDCKLNVINFGTLGWIKQCI